MEKEFKGTRLALEIDGEKAVWESPYTDHDVNDILQALRGLMVTHTYVDPSFVNTCGDIYKESRWLYEKEEKEDE
jgi:hypothetical protein